MADDEREALSCFVSKFTLVSQGLESKALVDTAPGGGSSYDALYNGFTKMWDSIGGISSILVPLQALLEAKESFFVPPIQMSSSSHEASASSLLSSIAKVANNKNKALPLRKLVLAGLITSHASLPDVLVLCDVSCPCGVKCLVSNLDASMLHSVVSFAHCPWTLLRVRTDKKVSVPADKSRRRNNSVEKSTPVYQIVLEIDATHAEQLVVSPCVCLPFLTGSSTGYSAQLVARRGLGDVSPLTVYRLTAETIAYLNQLYITLRSQERKERSSPTQVHICGELKAMSPLVLSLKSDGKHVYLLDLTGPQGDSVYVVCKGQAFVPWRHCLQIGHHYALTHLVGDRTRVVLPHRKDVSMKVHVLRMTEKSVVYGKHSWASNLTVRNQPARQDHEVMVLPPTCDASGTSMSFIENTPNWASLVNHTAMITEVLAPGIYALAPLQGAISSPAPLRLYLTRYAPAFISVSLRPGTVVDMKAMHLIFWNNLLQGFACCARSQIAIKQQSALTPVDGLVLRTKAQLLNWYYQHLSVVEGGYFIEVFRNMKRKFHNMLRTTDLLGKNGVPCVDPLTLTVESNALLVVLLGGYLRFTYEIYNEEVYCSFMRHAAGCAVQVRSPPLVTYPAVPTIAAFLKASQPQASANRHTKWSHVITRSENLHMWDITSPQGGDTSSRVLSPEIGQMLVGIIRWSDAGQLVLADSTAEVPLLLDGGVDEQSVLGCMVVLPRFRMVTEFTKLATFSYLLLRLSDVTCVRSGFAVNGVKNSNYLQRGIQSEDATFVTRSPIVGTVVDREDCTGQLTQCDQKRCISSSAKHVMYLCLCQQEHNTVTLIDVYVETPPTGMLGILPGATVQLSGYHYHTNAKGAKFVVCPYDSNRASLTIQRTVIANEVFMSPDSLLAEISWPLKRLCHYDGFECQQTPARLNVRIRQVLNFECAKQCNVCGRVSHAGSILDKACLRHHGVLVLQTTVCVLGDDGSGVAIFQAQNDLAMELLQFTPSERMRVGVLVGRFGPLIYCREPAERDDGASAQKSSELNAHEQMLKEILATGYACVNPNVAKATELDSLMTVEEAKTNNPHIYRPTRQVFKQPHQSRIKRKRVFSLRFPSLNLLETGYKGKFYRELLLLEQRQMRCTVLGSQTVAADVDWRRIKVSMYQLMHDVSVPPMPVFRVRAIAALNCVHRHYTRVPAASFSGLNVNPTQGKQVRVEIARLADMLHQRT